MTYVAQWGVVALFAGWLMLTIIQQFDDPPRWLCPRWVRMLLSADVFGLVPIWTFFAPNPGDTDTHLLYRDASGAGRAGPWREVPLSSRESVWHLWQPSRRLSKAVVDIVPRLMRPSEVEEPDDDGMQSVHKRRLVSFPYILLLNFVSQQDTRALVDVRQYAVARTDGRDARDEPRILFVSSWHDVGPNRDALDEEQVVSLAQEALLTTEDLTTEDDDARSENADDATGSHRTRTVEDEEAVGSQEAAGSEEAVSDDPAGERPVEDVGPEEAATPS